MACFCQNFQVLVWIQKSSYKTHFIIIQWLEYNQEDTWHRYLSLSQVSCLEVSTQKTGSSGHQLWLCLYLEDVCITLASSSVTWHWQHKHYLSAGRITDDNKILVYCNEIKSTLIHLKYSGTVERVSYKYIYLTTLSCHQSTGAWRRLRSGVTGTWETQIMSRCSVFIWFWFAPLSPVIHWLWLVDGDAVGGLLREPRPLWPTRHHRAQRAVSPEVGEERRH